MRTHHRFPALILALTLTLTSAGCLLGDDGDGGSDETTDPPVFYGSITVIGDMEGTFDFTHAVVIADTGGNLSIGLADNNAPFTVIIDIAVDEAGTYGDETGLLEIKASPIYMALPAKQQAMSAVYSTKTEGAGGLVTVTTFDGEFMKGHFTAILADGDRAIDVSGTFEIPLKTE